MFRKFLSSGAGVLALLCITALPGQVYAQRGHGGFRPGMTLQMGRMGMTPQMGRMGMTPQMGRMGMGFNRRIMNPQVGFDRRIIDPRLGMVPSFDRRFIDPRLGFTPNINRAFLSPQFGFGSTFNRRLFDSRFGGLTPTMNPQLMNLGLERQLLALHLGLF